MEPPKDYYKAKLEDIARLPEDIQRKIILALSDLTKNLEEKKKLANDINKLCETKIFKGLCNSDIEDENIWALLWKHDFYIEVLHENMKYVKIDYLREVNRTDPEYMFIHSISERYDQMFKFIVDNYKLPISFLRKQYEILEQTNYEYAEILDKKYGFSKE
jgi:hypothetical protein